MRIEQLEAFLAVAEIGNFGQAARKCGVTQSTISRQIQSLEDTLGLPLFHRSNQAKLTIGGEQLLPRARKICQEWQNSLQEFQDLKEGKQPELCVAGIHSVCAYFLPPILQSFCQDFPQVQLRVTALGSDRALKVLRDGLVDVAIVMNNRFLTATPEMVISSLYEEEIEILMSSKHPLTQYEKVPFEEVIEYPQVVFKDGYGMQRLLQDWFGRFNAKIKSVMELNTLDAFRGVVRQGNIIAFLPKSALLESNLDPSLTTRAIGISSEVASKNINFKREVILVTTNDRLEIPPIAHFKELVTQNASNHGEHLNKNKPNYLFTLPWAN